MGNLKLSRYLINQDHDYTHFITKLYAVKCFIKNIYIYIESRNSFNNLRISHRS